MQELLSFRLDQESPVDSLSSFLSVIDGSSRLSDPITRLDQIRDVRASLAPVLASHFLSGQATAIDVPQCYACLHTWSARWVLTHCLELVFRDNEIPFSVLLAGSLSEGHAHSNSDIDLVFLSRMHAVPFLRRLRNHFLAHMSSVGFTNCDIVIIPESHGRWDLPFDFIDRQISFSSDYFYGSHKLFDEFRYTRTFTIDDLLWSYVGSSIAYHWQSNVKEIAHVPNTKYMSGGSRDFMRIRTILRGLSLLHAPSHHLLSLQQEALALLPDRHLFDRYQQLCDFTVSQQSSSISSTLCASKSLSKAVARSATAVRHLYTRASGLLLSFAPPHFRRPFLELQERLHAQRYLSAGEYFHIKATHTPAIIAYATYLLGDVATVYECGSLVPQQERALEYYALALNKNTPPAALASLARLQGYEWRNIRDQVPRNPNTPLTALATLATSSLDYTRNRALSALGRRLHLTSDEAIEEVCCDDSITVILHGGQRKEIHPNDT